LWKFEATTVAYWPVLKN